MLKSDEWMEVQCAETIAKQQGRDWWYTRSGVFGMEYSFIPVCPMKYIEISIPINRIVEKGENLMDVVRKEQMSKQAFDPITISSSIFTLVKDSNEKTNKPSE